MEVRPEWLEPELECGRDPEVPARAAEAPEEIRLLGLAGANESTVGGHELDSGHVVDRQPEVALETANSPTERQPGDAGMADDANRADQPVCLGRDIELAEVGTTVRSGGPGPGVDLDAAHRRQVDHEPVIRAAEAGCAVAAGLDRDHQVVVSREADCRGDFLGGRRPNDGRRPPIVNRVP